MPGDKDLEFQDYRAPIWGIGNTGRERNIGWGHLGRTYYVHGTIGRDSNDYDGLSSEFPFLTITHALSHCVASANDVIVVLFYGSTPPATEVWPININKRGVKLIGGGGEDFMTEVTIIRPPVGTAVGIAPIQVNADDVEIAGLWIEGIAAGGSTTGGIDLGSAASYSRTHIHHCGFGMQTPLLYGIRGFAGFDLPSLLVHDCVFNDKITGDGIRLSQNATRGQIYNNQFRNVGGVGINLQALCTDIYAIHDNVFRVRDAAPGEAINCNAASGLCMIYNNIAMEGKIAFANIPWVEAGTNHWANNMSNILLVNPA